MLGNLPDTTGIGYGSISARMRDEDNHAFPSSHLHSFSSPWLTNRSMFPVHMRTQTPIRNLLLPRNQNNKTNTFLPYTFQSFPSVPLFYLLNYFSNRCSEFCSIPYNRATQS